MGTWRWTAAGAMALAIALAGCDDPLGVVRIHFLMVPPNVIDFGEDAGPPPVDPFDLSRAHGTLQMFSDIHHLTSEYEGLPTPTDPELAYLLWLSASERGGGWTLASPLTLRDNGEGAAHLDQAVVPFDYPTLRSAILTLDATDAEEPSSIVVLTGVVGNEPEAEAAPASGAPVHQH